jgi:hypothetical protein
MMLTSYNRQSFNLISAQKLSKSPILFEESDVRVYRSLKAKTAATRVDEDPTWSQQHVAMETWSISPPSKQLQSKKPLETALKG